MNANSIRGWLLQSPKPASIRAKCGDDLHTIKIGPGTTLARVAESLSALGPELLEAYDDKAQLLRATKPTADDDEDAEFAATEPTAATAAQSARAAKAMADAETARFNTFANHIAQAYRFATEIAFARMVDLFEAVNKRAEIMDRTIDNQNRTITRLTNENLKLQLENQTEGEETADPLGQIVNAFVGGANAGAASKTNGAPNGANGKGH
jgi:hypothetical protein